MGSFDVIFDSDSNGSEDHPGESTTIEFKINKHITSNKYAFVFQNTDQINTSTDSIIEETTEIKEQINESTDSVIEETTEIKEQINESNETLSEKIDSTTQSIINEVKKEELIVQFHLDKFTGGNLLIGNNGGKIILMKNFTIHWDYMECLQFNDPVMAHVIAEYRYEVSITKENGFKLIDTEVFKYGAGDIDKFLVEINYPELGVYTVWFSFDYNIFGTEDWILYQTENDIIEK